MLDKLEYICWELHEHIEQIMVLIEYRLNQIECNHERRAVIVNSLLTKHVDDVDHLSKDWFSSE